MSDNQAGLAAAAQKHLEWPRLAAAVLSRCVGESTRQAGLPIADNAQDMRDWLAEAGEALDLRRNGSPLPLTDLPQARAHLSRLSRNGALDLPGLADVLSLLRSARIMRAFLATHRGSTRQLGAAVALDPSLDALEAQLDDALEPDGTLSDRASSDLKRLRGEVSQLRERIVGRLQALIDKHQDILQDRFYTLREGRYVLPVRRDAHERFPGIVHGTSDSGASVFVEPRAVVERGNRLKMAQSELERECQRILAELSELLQEHVPALEAAMESLERLDLRAASARFAQETDGIIPELTQQPEMHLLGARHPLLVLDGVDVIENDATLEAGKGLVISGPNAGGKTVLLKVLGLSALMARAGLPLPVREGSRIGFFDWVLSDIGDEQSTIANLSTFSAHVRNLQAILERTGPATLVLLDELSGGTDPDEGAALACALVENLCERKAALAVTTHYEPLKALSMEDPRLTSASFGFDVERLQPSFRLRWGVPGASSALAVASRFGIPQAVIERAQQLLPERTRVFDRLVRTLDERLASLEAEREEVQRTSAENVQRAQALDAREQRLAERSQRKLDEEAHKLMQAVQGARSELEQTRKRLKHEVKDQQQLQQARRAVEAVAARVAIGGDLAPTPPQAEPKPTGEAVDAKALAVGDRVHVPHLRTTAVIVEPLHKGRVRVAAGPMRLWVDADQLHAAPAQAEPTAQHKPLGAVEGPTERCSDNTVDLRGLRVDDALSMLESFIDRLYAGPMRVGYVVHGHGTGALRDAVRGHLRDALSHVERQRAATKAEGGDAVTVFYLQ